MANETIEQRWQQHQKDGGKLIFAEFCDRKKRNKRRRNKGGSVATAAERRTYLLFDSRACGAQGTEDASVLVACESNREAKSYKGDYGAMACYSYRDDNGTLIDERWEWDFLIRRLGKVSAATQRSFTQEAEMTATAIAERVEQTPIAPMPNGAINPMALLQQAIDKGINPDDLGKLMDLAERFEKNRAAEAYGAAMAKFQAKCPRITKTRSVNAGPLKYQYASFDDVMAEAGPVLAECGIAVAFSTTANEYGIRVTVRLRVGIHSEDYTLDVPVPDMRVNDTQRYGAALSYAKRYALCAALNIVVTDEDNDAACCVDPITEEQEVQLIELLDQFKDPKEERKRFMHWLQVAKVSDIPQRDFQKAINALSGKLRNEAR